MDVAGKIERQRDVVRLFQIGIMRQRGEDDLAVVAAPLSWLSQVRPLSPLSPMKSIGGVPWQEVPMQLVWSA
jgi:hypothetical protein